jgi:GTP-binding protein HflX
MSNTPYNEALASTLIDRTIREKIVLYIGKGKAEELREIALETDCDTVVFDNELTPAQQRNLEKLLGRTAIDRTAVILDIFAQNAHSQEGKAQVELALLRYRLPRIRGKGTSLSQQGGGASAGGARIGTRGPGETQLEVDRRRIQRRIHKLEAELREIDKHRATQRKAQHRARTQRVAIVGYTNAGKSTLLNRLTDAGVLVEDRLFATLDATTRRLDLPGGETVLLTDTVGFITAGGGSPRLGGDLGGHRRRHRGVPPHVGRPTAVAQRGTRTRGAVRPWRRPRRSASRRRGRLGCRWAGGVDHPRPAVGCVGGPALGVHRR